MNMKYNCKVDNRWMWSLENACLTIQSPTGGSVRIDKWHMDDKVPESLRNLIHRIAKQDKEIELTRTEMSWLTTYPKAAIYKPKQKPVARKKMIIKKMNNI